MKNLFEGKKIYCGIDAHLKSWEIQVLTKNSVQKRIHMNPPSSQKVASYLEKNYPGGQYLCAYEAGFSGFWLQRELSELGIETLVLHPADIPTSDKEKRLEILMSAHRRIQIFNSIFSPYGSFYTC